MLNKGIEQPCYFGKRFVMIFAIIGIIAVGFLFRFEATNFERAPALGDETTYINAANSLLENGFLTWDPYNEMASGSKETKPTTALSPGLPVYLAAVFSTIGNSPKNLIALNVAFSIGSLVLTFFVLNSIVRNDYIKLACLSFVSIYPGLIYNLDRVLTEQIFLFLFLLFFFAFIKGLRSGLTSYFVLAGLAIGYAIQIRVFAMPFLLLACIFIVTFRTVSIPKSSAQIFSLTIPALFFMSLYWLYSWITFGHVYWLPQSSYGPQLWGASPYFLEMNYAETMSLNQLWDMNAKAMPFVFWKWRLFGFFQYMWGDLWDENISHPHWFLRNFIALHLFVAVPTVLAIPYAIRRHQPEVLMVACIPIAFTLMNMPFHGVPRYVWPSIPFVFVTLGVVLERLTGASPRPYPFQGPRLEALSTFMHGTLFGISLLFSLILFYSVFFFAWNIGEEMSNVRLLRHYKLDTSRIDNLKPSTSAVISPDQLLIENANEISNGAYINNEEGPSIIRLANSLRLISHDGNVATKLTIRSKTTSITNYMTVYWTGAKTKEINENTVYSRFPINRFQNEHIVYIDDDITNILIVPSGYIGSGFLLKEIQVDKYVIRN